MTFFSPLLLITTLDEATIKHLMLHFLYTERACVHFSGFEICLGKVFDMNQSVATISDKREYILF